MKKRMLSGFVAGLLTLAGGVYLSAVPARAAESASFSCMSEAIATYNFVQKNICGGLTDCSFQCTPDNSGVSSFSCTCG